MRINLIRLRVFTDRCGYYNALFKSFEREKVRSRMKLFKKSLVKIFRSNFWLSKFNPVRYIRFFSHPCMRTLFKLFFIHLACWLKNIHRCLPTLDANEVETFFSSPPKRVGKFSPHWNTRVVKNHGAKWNTCLRLKHLRDSQVGRKSWSWPSLALARRSSLSLSLFANNNTAYNRIALNSFVYPWHHQTRFLAFFSTTFVFFWFSLFLSSSANNNRI